MPAASKTLEAFGDLQRSLAQATMQAVAVAVKTVWKELYLDIRSTPAGTAHAIIFRVISISGALLSVPTPTPIDALVREVWDRSSRCTYILI